MFLKLDGVDGELKDKDHKDKIDILFLQLRRVQHRHRAATAAARAPARRTSPTSASPSTSTSRRRRSIKFCYNGKHIDEGRCSRPQGGRRQSARISQVRAERGVHHLVQSDERQRGRRHRQRDRSSLNFSKIEDDLQAAERRTARGRGDAGSDHRRQGRTTSRKRIAVRDRRIRALAGASGRAASLERRRHSRRVVGEA